MKKLASISLALVIIVAFALSSCATAGGDYDIAINNGRVMDPLTGFDGVANVGIKDGKIAAVVPAKQKLGGKRVINASGLVVAPGFINIHGHATGGGIDGGFHVRDGITTEITGNCGRTGVFFYDMPGAIQFTPYPVTDFFSEVEKQGLVINIGTYTGNITLREAIGLKDKDEPTPEQIARMVEMTGQEMEAGSLGISYGPFYAPGTTYQEMVDIAKETLKHGGGAAIHVRYAIPPPRDIEACEEAISLSKDSGIPILISHRGGQVVFPESTDKLIDLITRARAEGVQVSSDLQPYTASNTPLKAAVFDMPLEPFAKLLDVSISDVGVGAAVVIDGNTVIKPGDSFASFEQFYDIRDRVKAGEIPDPTVIMHIYKAEKIALYFKSPFVMVENDGLIVKDPNTGRYTGHPRGAGAFAKFFREYVREQGICDLMTGIAKCSTMAAVWLGMENKGRVQVGCDADLTLFDPEKITDKATYVEPGQPSEGIPYVIVNGILAVDKGKLTGSKSGKVIKRNWTVPGVLPELGKAATTNINVLQQP
ncbi:MAG: amidohydrolase family protein [Chloroflexi bacterium]|nr:amidohydrolase family protein [Chloroflexota bacterium]MBM3165872.1 amidohydrolase family protein [Chloroflexota bacterium]MBM3172714.1 amidohydrolase family protein [Chloroflexota bacterium]MBM4449266.1 amidohydrolase family protein [Chloroflexota bacterium]